MRPPSIYVNLYYTRLTRSVLCDPDPRSERLFSKLGYVIHDPVEPGESVLIVPPKEPAAWLQTRARLMRAWVELSVFLDEYRYERRQSLPLLHLHWTVSARSTGD